MSFNWNHDKSGTIGVEGAVMVNDYTTVRGARRRFRREVCTITGMRRIFFAVVGIETRGTATVYDSDGNLVSIFSDLGRAALA